MTTAQELKARIINEVFSSEDWNKMCEDVKREFKGYPAWWYPEIVASGFADTVMARWGGDSSIKVGYLPRKP